MTTPKTLSAEELKEAIEIVGDWETFFRYARGEFPRDKMYLVANALLQERRRTEELDKEVERLQQECDSLNIRRESLVLERDAAIERAEKAEKLVSDQHSLLGEMKETRDQALALAEGYREALEAVDYCCCDIESVDGHHLYVCCKHQALAATPTSLLERFKADEKIIEAAKGVAEFTAEVGLNNCPTCRRFEVHGNLNRALEAREKLK